MPRLYVGFLFCAMIVVGDRDPRCTREEKRLIFCAKILVMIGIPRSARDKKAKAKRRVREGATSQTRLLSKRTAFGYPMAALLVSRDANPLITFASGLLEG